MRTINKDITNDLNPHKKLIYNNTGLSKKIIIDPKEVFNKTIMIREPIKNKKGFWECRSSPIAHIHDIDSEFQNTGNLLSSLAKYNGGYDSNDKQFTNQNDFINYCNHVNQNYLNVFDVNIHEVISNPLKYRNIIKNIPEDYLINNDYTLKPPELITIHIKNSFENEEKGKIYISNLANEIRESYIKDNPNLTYKFQNYKYPILLDEKTIIEQFMQDQGYEYKIEIVDSQTYYDEILPTLSINLVMFFGLVDIPYIFQNEYYDSIDYFIKKGTISHDKRFKSNSFDKELKRHKQVKPHWIVTINTYKYKVRLNFIDVSAMQGVIGLKQFYKNNNIDVVDKGLLDEYKPRMIEALLEEPENYHNYALGDIQLYKAVNNFNKNICDISKKIGIEEKRIEEIKYTLGSTCNNLIINKEYQSDNVNSNEEKINFLDKYCKSSSSNYLGIYNHFDNTIKDLFDYTNSIYIRMILAKLDGGRCNSTNPLLFKIYYKDIKKQNFTFDIDMVGAYTSAKSNMYKYYGEAISYLYRIEEYFTLREYINIFKKELGKDNYIIKVSGILKWKQDLIQSWINSDKSKKIEIDKDDQNNNIVVVKYNMKNTKNIILTNEIIDGTITSSILDIILNGLHPKQRDDILDNLKVCCMLIYPLSMEVKTLEELKKRSDEHNNGDKDYSFKLHEQYIDKSRGNKCHHYIKKDFGRFFIDDIRAFRNFYKFEGLQDSLNKEELFKLIGNTSYGVSVSELFPNSDIIFGNNITANVRAYMWLIEKALNVKQSITDGGFFDFFNVKHPIYDYLDSRLFVNSYKYSNKQLSQNKKWYNRPLNYKEPIYNKKSKIWFLDNVEYIEKPIVNNEAYYNSENNKWVISGEEFNDQSVKNKINELCVTHIQKCFPKVKFINEDYRCFKIDNEGKVIFDNENNIVYTTQKGMFDLEVKNIINKVYVSGMSNYMFYDYKGKQVIKTRSWETKKDDNGFLRKEHTAILNSENNLFELCKLTYSKIAITEKYYNLRNINEESVPLIEPSFIPTILKTKDYNKKYESTYKYNPLIRVGSTVYKLVQKLYFEISQFHFLCREQYISLERLNAKLKREHGLGIEIFFINKDGTINVKKMNEVINDMINNEVIDFLKGNKKIDGLDPHNHINRKIPNKIKEYVKRLEHARDYLRILNVGMVQYVKENGKIKEDVTDYNQLDFDDLHKKSHHTEFKNEDEIWK